MIRVVIDTNVLVSALLTSGGLPEAVIDLAISGEVQWFASESVLAEYEEVLKRPRLAIDSEKAADAMARIRAASRYCPGEILLQLFDDGEIGIECV